MDVQQVLLLKRSRFISKNLFLYSLIFYYLFWHIFWWHQRNLNAWRLPDHIRMNTRYLFLLLFLRGLKTSSTEKYRNTIITRFKLRSILHRIEFCYNADTLNDDLQSYRTSFRIDIKVENTILRKNLKQVNWINGDNFLKRLLGIFDEETEAFTLDYVKRSQKRTLVKGSGCLHGTKFIILCDMAIAY